MPLCGATVFSPQIHTESPRSAASAGCLAALAEDEVRDPPSLRVLQEEAASARLQPEQGKKKTDQSVAAAATTKRMILRFRRVCD